MSSPEKNVTPPAGDSPPPAPASEDKPAVAVDLVFRDLHVEGVNHPNAQLSRFCAADVPGGRIIREVRADHNGRQTSSMCFAPN